MPFRPNYRLRRADRARAQKARTEEKVKKLQERASERKPDNEVERPAESGGNAE